MIRRLLLNIMLLLCPLVITVTAKDHLAQKNASAVFETAPRTAAGLRIAVGSFESILSPYFRQRSNRNAVAVSLHTPSQADLFTIAKYWNLLTPLFQSMYLKAMDLPGETNAYLSPGGHFEILYYTTGEDAVDTTDTAGYSSNDWRIKVPEKNGVPDYIDEVAFAADSAWSMEVDRFGFGKPLASVNAAHPSSRYKILVHLMPNGFYGQTNPTPGQQGAGTIGEPSYIEMRNQWNGADWNSPPFIDYNTHPEKAVRVTCAHEFFHALQYSRTWQVTDYVWLDDFPISWTEGSAVLMEDLCFDYVNDYIQYLDYFFNSPLSAMLDSSSTGTTIYKNSIALMYIYQFAAGGPAIDFVKTMYDNNVLQKAIPFLDNLRLTSRSLGRTWADIFGSFFTGSYYTGARSAPGRFIADSRIIGKNWSYASDAADIVGAVRKDVLPFGMNTFSHANGYDNSDKLTIDFLGDSLLPGESDTDAVWNVHCILKKDTIPADDSLFSLDLSEKIRGKVIIPGWQKFTEALVIAVNAKNDHSRSAAVSFTTCETMIAKGTRVQFKWARQNTAPNAVVNVLAKSDLACSLSIAKTTISPQLLDKAKSDNLTSTGTFFTLAFPPSWLRDASMNLTIGESSQTVRAIQDTLHVPDYTFSIYRWDKSLSDWVQCPSIDSGGADSIRSWQCDVAASGIVGIFCSNTAPIAVYPNPVRLKINPDRSPAGSVTFGGKSILEIWIYGINGVLISHAVKGQSSDSRYLSDSPNGFIWRLCSNSGKPVSPGVYYSWIGYKDDITKGMKKKTQKIFIVP